MQLIFLPRTIAFGSKGLSLDGAWFVERSLAAYP